jgi:signal peptidase I
VIRRFCIWFAVGVLVGMVGLVTAPRLIGITPFTVLTGSMEPAFAPGDVVLSEGSAPLSVRPGDVVTFHDPSRGGELVTHRVESMRRTDAMVAFVTRGDANDVAERWSVPVDGTIGRAVLRVPEAGHVLQWAGTREGKIGLIAVPAFVLVLLELVGLAGAWRRPASEGAA